MPLKLNASNKDFNWECSNPALQPDGRYSINVKIDCAAADMDKVLERMYAIAEDTFEGFVRYMDDRMMGVMTANPARYHWTIKESQNKLAAFTGHFVIVD